MKKFFKALIKGFRSVSLFPNNSCIFEGSPEETRARLHEKYPKYFHATTEEALASDWASVGNALRDVMGLPRVEWCKKHGWHQEGKCEKCK